MYRNCIFLMMYISYSGVFKYSKYVRIYQWCFFVCIHEFRLFFSGRGTCPGWRMLQKVTESARACSYYSLIAGSIKGGPCLSHFWLYRFGCATLAKGAVNTVCCVSVYFRSFLVVRNPRSVLSEVCGRRPRSCQGSTGRGAASPRNPPKF